MTHSALYSFLACMVCMGRRWVRCKSRQTHTVYERERGTYTQTHTLSICHIDYIIHTHTHTSYHVISHKY